MSEWAERLKAAATEALPPVEGEVRVQGLGAPVEVVRDRWGVPHISAADDGDLFFAQGYVAASERLFQIEFLIRLGLGRLAEAFGPVAASLDRFIRTVGWNRAGRRLAARHDQLSRDMVEAYHGGMRAWTETMPAPPVEYRALHLEPWLPPAEEAGEAIAAAAAALSWSLSRNWDAELLRAEIAERLGPEALGTFFPDPPREAAAVVAGKEPGPDRLALLREAPLPPSGQGSNNWVVAGSRSDSGMPLLANDPHLVVGVPSVWFECHLSAPGIDVAGVALPFHPGVILGHNDHIAWGFTNTEADVQDLYGERLSEDGTGAEYGGEWEDLTVHREEIVVRGGDPQVLEVRETRHGPLVDAYLVGIAEPVVVERGIRQTYALRWVGADAGVEPSVVYRLNTARGWDDFRASLEAWHCPGQNVVYADVGGNIGYQLSGRYPLRRKGDGTMPVPGWTDEFEWDGWVPYDELPRAFNPVEGFLCTANNRPHHSSYPHLLGRDFLPPYRARRIAEMITERDRHSRESFAHMQVDTRSLPAATIVPRLLRLEPADDRQKRALALLAEWDLDLSADSAAAALYETWCVHIARRVLLPLLGEELFTHFYARRQWTNAFQYQVLPDILEYPTARWFGREGAEGRDAVLSDALDGALDELAIRLGDDPAAWRWGDLHRVRFAGTLAVIPELKDLLTAGEISVGGDEQTVLQGLFEPGQGFGVVVAPSWRLIIDLADLDATLGVHAPGQSGHPASQHFRDLLPLWERGEHHPMPFTRPAVEAAAEATLRLMPAD